MGTSVFGRLEDWEIGRLGDWKGGIDVLIGWFSFVLVSLGHTFEIKLS
jgi:hypothetical protein